MTIELAKDVEALVREQAQTAGTEDPAALVNELLRSLCEQRKQTFETSPELEAWLLEAADKPASPLISEDFDAIRRRRSKS